MQISVIIAVYNRASLLSDLLDHWRKVDLKTKYEYELIFSDDESHDESVSILRDCDDLPIRVLTNKHGGAAQARNHAYEYASGEIIIFTGDDIFPTPNFLNEHYESYLKNGKEYATLGCIEWRDGIKMNHLMKHITDIGCEQFGFVGMKPFEIIDFRHFYTSNVSVAREQLEKIEGLFDPAFKKYGFEDIDLGYRLHKLGVQIFYNPNALGHHDHIYDSVVKFCKRQQSAGEELNTFKRLHPDLSVDEIKVDIDEFHTMYKQYSSKNNSFDLVGDLGRLLIQLMIKSTQLFEMILKRKNSFKLKKICSKFYAAIFSYYMYLGLALGYTESKHTRKRTAQRFTFRFLFFGRSQIFFDKKNNFNEKNSVFVRAAGEKLLTLSSRIPIDHLGGLRFDPLDHYCKMHLEYAHAILSDGSKKDIVFNFTNAIKTSEKIYDFSNQMDPVLICDQLPEGTISVEIRYQLNYLLQKRFYSIFRKILKLMKKSAKKAFLLIKQKKKQINTESITPVVINSQQIKKKVWITVSGPSDQDIASLVEYYQEHCSFISDLHIDTLPCSSEDYLEYIYEINLKECAIESSQLANAALCLMQKQYDFIILSDSLNVFPIINGYSLKESTLLARHLAPFDLFITGITSSTGKFLRIPGSKQIENELNLKNQFPKMDISGNDILYVDYIRDLVWLDQINLSQTKKIKPLVFVLPVFMAVGGVERNTIEVMERLKNEYDFVVITIESHRTEQGSLFYQIARMGIDYFDFAEITSFDNYLNLFKNLRESYKPELIWICNSSPWMMDNSTEIRKVFNDSAIVVQDVYDYEYGWIQYYHKPAIHSYDRFIAINKKIQEKFINTYGINAANIDLVYPAVDNTKIIPTSVDSYSREAELSKFNLDPQKMHFVFIGRFTEQKQPLKVLALAKYIIETYENADFVMVGDGELSSKVAEVIAKTPTMKNRVHRINYIADVPSFIKATDGLIIASIYEGLPIVTIEAMCVSTPIFATDVGDIALFVRDKNIGIVSQSHELELLKTEFDEFFDNLDLFKRNLVEQAPENIKFFSSERAAELMNMSFQQALKNIN
ncbi:glycosyltransferase [Paenibacillus sp. FSL R10-2771]|uniref:glycosyltransferase n=1 Tax=Paenibacillus sp. FSL R10-2771 TaxID=2954693 RepID=UPI0030F580AE